MTKIALLSSEPLRQRVAGIGLRYLEFARRLPSFGVEVVTISPAEPDETPLPEGTVRRFEAGKLRELLADCDGAVAQGFLANSLLVECPELPTAIDLYDPWLVENLCYAQLSDEIYRNDHAAWMLQLSRGDFFLCSSEEQRLYYLGLLTALGRVNPHSVADDPDVSGLIAQVPFGVPDELPPHRPLIEPVRQRGTAGAEVRLLFGALYDWYDPWTLIDALEILTERAPHIPWALYFVRHPNPESTPQQLLRQVAERCRARGWWGTRVREIDWVPADRRFDLLRDMDMMAATHRRGLESRLSMRTRLLEALAASCPVVVSEGGTISRLVAEHDAGWLVPPENAVALARTLEQAMSEVDREAAAQHARGGARLAQAYSWDKVIEPLAAFCRAPRRDPSRKVMPMQMPAVARVPIAVRAMRRLRRLVKFPTRTGRTA